MGTRYRYTEEDLATAVEQSFSIAGVMRILGVKPAGGSHFHISKRIQQADLDISHFTGKAHTRGKVLPNKRKQPGEILRLNHANDPRTRAHLLRRALIEVGVKCVCAICEVGAEWQNRPLVLHVDHVNGQPHDCRIENLRFLCPNCHSQTASYCRKTSSRNSDNSCA